MNQERSGHEESEQGDDMKSDDVERELYSSVREASIGFAAFADLDFSRAAPAGSGSLTLSPTRGGRSKMEDGGGRPER